MRIRHLLPTFALASAACASRPAPVSLTETANCPFRVVTTVSNRRAVPYDVYYQDGARTAVVLGEVAAGSTQTFTIPGEGRGRVFLRGRGGGYVSERPGNPVHTIEIRMHCAG